MKGQPQCELETLFLATPVGEFYNNLQPGTVQLGRIGCG
jgi:hypothetical protein